MRGAQRHVLELERIVNAYIAMPPYREERTPEPDGRLTVTRRVTYPPPLSFGVVFGDVLHCCNSALDHVAWAFARTVSDPPDDRTHWPLYQSAKTFADRRRGSLRHIPPDVLAAFEEMQPYQAEESVGGELGRQLLTMRTLANEDKHRVLPVVTTFTEPRAVAFNGEVADIEWLGAEAGRLYGIRLSARAARGEIPVKQFWDTLVTIRHDQLPPWVGILDIADMLRKETESAIASLKAYWPVLRSLPEDASAWWAGG